MLRFDVLSAACLLGLIGNFALFSSARAQSCDAPPQCTTPSSGNSCVSGQLYDLESGGLVRETSPSGMACAQQAATGPCSIGIAPFDALDFFQNPETAPQLSGNVVIDDCGFFVVDFVTPPLGFVVLTTDGGSLRSDLILGAGLLGVSNGGQIDAISLYSVLATTDQAWTVSAGDPFAGQTFSETGVLVVIFRDGSVPASGTVLTRSGITAPSDDYYFGDGAPLVKSMIDITLNATGVNGAALFVNSPLATHSGIGGELPGCIWPSELLGSVSGAVVVQEFYSIDSTTGQRCVAPIAVEISIPSAVTILFVMAAASLMIHRRRVA